MKPGKAVRLRKVALIASLIRRRANKRKRSTYIRELFKNRANQGEYSILQDLEKDDEYHKKYFRYSCMTFLELIPYQIQI